MPKHTPRLRTHPFTPTDQTDQQNNPICTCGSIRKHAVHNTPERTDEQRAAEARRIGE